MSKNITTFKSVGLQITSIILFLFLTPNLLIANTGNPNKRTTNKKARILPIANSLKNQQQSLSEVLNIDGTIKTGINGSFNASGFKMTQGKDGKPVFMPGSVTNTGDSYWDSRASNSITSQINVIAVNGSTIYAGGNNIYAWNGTSWAILGGNGVNNNVNAIVISGTEVYIGGVFTTAGGNAASRIAKWNGSSWSALGAGVNGTVKSLAFSGTDLYVGGDFSMAGGSPANYVAKWNGSSWSALGTGMDSQVLTLAVSGTDLYAGGDFTMAGNSSANYIAKWNGSSWSTLGVGVDNTVNAITVSGTDVYVGGYFNNAGGNAANYIAKWNGSSWAALGMGFNNGVTSIVVSGTDVYAGGFFTTAGGSNAKRIAKWNGSSWTALGTGFNNPVFSVCISGTDLYVGGEFNTITGSPGNYLVKWNGSSWATIGTALDSYVNTIAVSGSDVYVGGAFITIGNNTVNYIAKWNGSSWSPLGTGLNDIVNAIAISGNDVFVGGDFTVAGGNSANYIAKWNGNSWSTLGTGVNDIVKAIAVSGTDVYVGGNFTIAGGNNANRIAKWNGSSWSPLGSGLNNSVYVLTTSETDLYVGGNFTIAGGNNANYIAKWNGSSWSPLGIGVNNLVISIAVSGSELYAGGTFTTAGGSSAKYIAKWNGSSWLALGTGVAGNSSPFVRAISISGKDVYVGGDFTTAGGSSANHIAKWDGNSWSSLGTGIDGSVYSIGISSGAVHTGGSFNMVATNNLAPNFAIYHYVWQWSGSASTAWENVANWSYNVSPAMGDDVVIPSTGVINNPTLNSTISLHNLSIEAGRVFTVGNAGNLNTTNEITVSPGGAIAGNYNNINGTTTLQQNFVGQRGWRMLANPFNSEQTISTLASSNGITINTVAQASGLTDIRTFSNSTNTWNNVTSNGILANASYGLFYRGLASEVSGLTYTGGPSPLTYSASGILNGATTSVTPASTTNFLIVGNPYAAPVTSSSLTNGAGIPYYVYTIAQGGTQALQRTSAGSWSPILASSTTTTIPVMGVISYKPTTTNSYNITAATDINTGGTLQTGLFRTQGALEYLELQVEKDSLLKDKVFVRHDEKATGKGIDKTDLEKFWNDNFNIYTKSIDNKYLSIDTRAAMDSIPLGISAAVGNYTFKLASNNFPADYTIYLTDNFLNRKTELKQNSIYSFIISNDAASKGEKRFVLNFSKSKPIDIIQGFEVKVLGNIIKNNSICLNIAGSDEPIQVVLTDLLGRKITSINNLSNGRSNITLNEMQAGVYFLRISNGKTAIVEKIVKQ